MQLNLGIRFDLWLYGLWSAFVGGGAGAIGSGVAASTMNLTKSPHDTLVLMGWTFLITGIISAAAYLKEHPAPQWDSSQPDRRQPPSAT